MNELKSPNSVAVTLLNVITPVVDDKNDSVRYDASVAVFAVERREERTVTGSPDVTYRRQPCRHAGTANLTSRAIPLMNKG